MTWFPDRHRHILNLLEAHGRVATESLAQDLNVSRETVRRDFLDLEAQGLLKRVRGGAVALGDGDDGEPPFRRRMKEMRREKESLTTVAAGLLRPGQSCFVDAGTTTSVLAGGLARIPDILVLTNSVDVAQSIARVEGECDVLLLGGQIDHDVPGTFGELTLSQVQRFHADFAFISPVGVHPQGGVYDFRLKEAEVAAAMIAQAATAVVLADHSKLGRDSRVRICDCTDIDILVTDSGADDVVLERFRRAGVGEVRTAR